MKIGILTQPLHTNYGGLLQAYALQVVLKKMGHEVWTIDRQFKDISTLIKVLSIAKRLILKFIFHKPVVIRTWSTTSEKQAIAKNTNRFIKENIQITKKIDTSKKMSILNKYQFEAYIVGSDQVWRPEYSPCLENYFLDFLVNENKARRIAYAASFGIDQWEFSPNQTAQCALLAKQFNEISVREDSAVTLCKEYLDVDAIHVLDPTMLLTKEDYIRLVEKDNIPKSKGTLMTYVLDSSPEKKEIIQNIAKELNLIPFSVMPEKTFPEAGYNRIPACVYPPVTEWIRGFMDADFVFTDSFHGTVFAIIFNKPFIAIGNEDRGLTRFNSLLKTFNLEYRLISDLSNLNDKLIYKEINWERINLLLNKKRKQTNDFFKNNGI